MDAMRLPDEVRAHFEWDLLRRKLDALIALGMKGVPERGIAPPPAELHLELTHRCDLKCVMCEHWQQEHLDPGSPAREMDFDAWKRLSISPLLDGIKVVVITGGEPWLRHDIEDVLGWLSERFPAADIIVLTNLWNGGHLARALGRVRARVPRLRLGSSLDGLGEVHDQVRGQPGAFDGLVRTVKMLKTAFPEVPFGFTFTFVPENAGELEKTFRFVRDELGASLGAQWAVQTPGIKPLAWTPELIARARAGIRAVTLSLAREHGAWKRLAGHPVLDDAWLIVDLLYWVYLEEYGARPRRFDFFRRCTAGERHLMVGAEGEAFFCPVNRGRAFGDARGTKAADIWSSSAAEREREYSESGQCHCWLRCVSVPALNRIVESAVGRPVTP